MSTKLFLVIVLSFVFCAAFVEGAHQLEQRIPKLDTNAKRFAAGFPPLPPVQKRSSQVDSARRPRRSPAPKLCYIEVTGPYGERLGYVSKNLKDGHFTLKRKERKADIFSAYIRSYGETANMNLMDEQKQGYYLAGIIYPGTVLAPDSNGIAMLGDSLPTQPGDSPRYDTQPTIPGESETAIWTYSPDDHRLGAQWVNAGYSGSQTVSVHILYNKSHDTFYLSGSDHHDSCVHVEFHLDCDDYVES